MILFTPQPVQAEYIEPVLVAKQFQEERPIYSEALEAERRIPEPTIEDLIRSYDWEDEIALRIAKCESNLNPKATNEVGPDNSYGIMQINIKGDLAKNRPSKEELFDPKTNLDFAYKLYKEGGWKHWKNCYNKI